MRRQGFVFANVVVRILCYTLVVCNCQSSNSSGDDVAEFIESLLTQPSYNKKVRPGINEGVPTVVWLNFYVQSVSDINEVSMDYSISIYARQLWQDNRLAFTEYNEGLVLNYDQVDRLWVPDLFIRNEKESRFHDVTVPNRLLKLYPNGTIYYSQRLTMTLTCEMALENYPMDVQECNMAMESYGYTTKDIIFKWKNELPVQVNKNMVLPEFYLDTTAIATSDCTEVYITGNFTCMMATFRFVRQFKYYLVQTFIPSSLIVALSWVSFWIDSSSVPARISLGLLTVLTMTTQSSSISSRLPRVSYVKAIDIWMTACLTFVFGALIEYSIVNYLSQVDARNKEKAAEALREELEAKQEAGNGGNGTGAIILNIQSDKARRSKCGHRMKTHRAEFVDYISRILFPFLFFIFNIAFWCSFQVPASVLYPDKVEL